MDERAEGSAADPGSPGDGVLSGVDDDGDGLAMFPHAQGTCRFKTLKKHGHWSLGPDVRPGSRENLEDLERQLDRALGQIRVLEDILGRLQAPGGDGRQDSDPEGRCEP